jgi:DNA invertase Pin-like site-specific DNA recombinase
MKSLRRAKCSEGRPKRTVDRDEILKLKAAGHSLRRIATALGVGYGTVRTRLANQAG